MKRHPFDALSFIFGITFVVLAGALSVDGLDVTGGILRWIGAGVLLLAGAVMLLTTRSGERSAPDPAQPLGSEDENR